jgi:transcription antitermination factor NusA-like protein
MLSEEVKNVARKIGQFYLEKNNQNYELTEKDIDNLRISKIEIVDDKIAITTAAPGRLIGMRGKNILLLQEYLGQKVKIIEEMDPLFVYLIPQEPDQDYDYDYELDLKLLDSDSDRY